MRDAAGATVAELVVAAQAGDRGSWNELIARYDGMVRAVANRAWLQDADVAQGIWLSALEQLGRLRDPERFGGWLRTIVLRECLAVRSLHRREHLGAEVGDHVLEPASGPEEQVLRAEARRAVRAAVDDLGERGRLVVEVLFYRTRVVAYATIAQLKAIPVGSIGPARGRALRRLRDTLEYAGFGAGPAATERAG